MRKIYMVNSDPENLLLVSGDKWVVNGSWTLENDVDGFYCKEFPNGRFELTYVMDAPDTGHYNEALDYAKQQLKET